MNHSKSKIPVEICVAADNSQSISDAVSAVLAGGASRIELCQRMDSDGLTPEMEQIREARSAFQLSLLAMIRPRAGSFQYSSEEVHLMRQQITASAEAGASGIVLGLLDRSGLHIDQENIHHLVEFSHEFTLSVTFHRAFDAVPEPRHALDILIEAGVDRVLTSGSPWGSGIPATQGIDRLTHVIEHSRGQIEIVVGGGVNAGNVRSILNAIPLQYNNVSVHAYSSVMVNGSITPEAVASLVRGAAMHTADQ